MSTTFQDQLTECCEVIRQAAGVPLTYFAGDTEIELPLAVLGPPTQVYRGNTFVETREILVKAEDLAISGTQIEPQVGHRLTEESGDKINHYEVAILEEKKPAWRWSDTHNRTTRRIFTTFVKAESA